MRPAATLRPPARPVGPQARQPGVEPLRGVQADRMRLTPAFLGLSVYLWVVHSAKLAVGTYGILLGLIGVFLQAERLRVPAPLLWFGAWVLWAAVTAPLALNTAAASDAVIEFGKLWLIFLVAANVAHSRRQLATLIVVWLGIYALYPVRGTFFNFIFGIQIFGRYAWNFIFANPNDLAALTLLVLALAVATLQGEQQRKWIRYSALAGVIVLPILIVITQSRGGILALGTFGLMVLVQYRRQAKGLAITALAAGAIYLIAPPDVWDRLAGLARAGDPTTLREVDEEGSAEQRFEIWKVAVAIAKDHPVAGIGIGGYPAAHAEYASTGSFDRTARGERDTHSIYLNTLAETGVIGLLLLLGMMASALWQGWRAAVKLRLTDPVASKQIATLVVGLIAFLQAGIFGSLHRVAFPYVYLGIFVCAVTILGSASTEGKPTRGAVGPRRRRTPAPARRAY